MSNERVDRDVLVKLRYPEHISRSVKSAYILRRNYDSTRFLLDIGHVAQSSDTDDYPLHEKFRVVLTRKEAIRLALNMLREAHNIEPGVDEDSNEPSLEQKIADVGLSMLVPNVVDSAKPVSQTRKITL